MAAPTIVSVVPASGTEGVPVNTTISITFDQEVDNYRLANGGIVLEGPDESKSIGPGFLDLYPPATDEDEFLASPGYKGIVDVTYSFQRVDNSGSVVPYYDYGSGSGAGELYRTKITLTPKEVLAGLTRYTVYIIGDEDQTDDYALGVSTRTVFDTIKGAVLGSGETYFYGGYSGSIRDRFHVKITTGGAVGTAEYEWWRNSDTVHRTGRTSTAYRLLEDGVEVKFSSSGTFQTDDAFSVWCDVPVYMASSYSFSFVTSEHTVEELPTPSTVVTGLTGSTVAGTVTAAGLSVTETSPADRATQIDIDTTEITVTFSDSLDSTTVTDSTVTVEAIAIDESIDGSIPYTGELTKSLSVSGSTLTVTLDADQLYQNNLVVVVLDDSIASTDSETLGTDYEFFFGTTLFPFYSGTRHVRLRLGSLGNNFPDETINMAIWDASREALVLTPPEIVDSAPFTRARTMFVVCLAAWYVAGGGRISGGGARKRLADLDVSRDSSITEELVADLKDCFERYELALRSGGDAGFGTAVRPVVAIKGEDDLDEPYWGRRWMTGAEVPIGNARYTETDLRRWYRTYYRRNRSRT